MLIREVMHFTKERDLLDRLMSKDFSQYKTLTQPETENELEVQDDGMLSIDDPDVKNELLYGTDENR